MKKLLLGAILLFSVMSCSTDGVDGINGINGVDGKNGTNGTNGTITDTEFRWKALFPYE
nr:hypothetical protein [uncultured Flavobacterium sp.]